MGGIVKRQIWVCGLCGPHIGDDGEDTASGSSDDVKNTFAVGVILVTVLIKERGSCALCW